MIFLDKGIKNKWKSTIFAVDIMNRASETNEKRQGHSANIEDDDSTYDHIVKYTGFLGGIQVLTLLVGVIRNKLAAVLLNTAGVGLSSLYLNVLNFLQNASGLGISFSSIKEISEFYGKGDEAQIVRHVGIVRTWGVWTGLAGMLFCVLFSPLISFCAFKDFSHVGAVCLLSPVVGFMSVTAAELAVLKAVRRLKRVALISVLSALAALVATIPFYYFWGIRGVVPALVVSALGVMAAHLWLSVRVFPWKIGLWSKDYFRAGWSMVRLGVPYIMATVVTTAVGMGMGLFIARMGSLSDVGLYNMGYNLVFVYAGIVFTAVDADYVPRLSAVNHDQEWMNSVVNRQIKVGVLLMSPFLVLFMLAMPLVVCTLYTSAFLPMVDMAIWASMHMFFKSMTLPVAYISLSKGDSIMFFCMEVAYDAFMALCVMAGYLYCGVLGTGIALALAGIFDWCMINAVYGRRYGFRLEQGAHAFMSCQFVCVVLALALGLQPLWWLKVVAGAVVLAASIGVSVQVLRRETTLFSSFKKRLSAKFSRVRRER